MSHVIILFDFSGFSLVSGIPDPLFTCFLVFIFVTLPNFPPPPSPPNTNKEYFTPILLGLKKNNIVMIMSVILVTDPHEIFKAYNCKFFL